MAAGETKGLGYVKPALSEYETPIFDPLSPQFRLKSISGHLKEKIDTYKLDKSSFNRADLNFVTAHATSLIKEAKITGAETATISLVQSMINEATRDLRSAEIAFGATTQAPQIPYIPQIKLPAPLIPKTGNRTGDALATLPNGVSIAGTAFISGGINAVAGIPNAASGVINTVVGAPAKINDFFSLVQKNTGETSAKSWLNNPFRHYAYNARLHLAQVKRKNKIKDEIFKAEQRKNGAVPAYSEAIFGFLGSFAVDVYIGGKVFKNPTRSKVTPKGQTSENPPGVSEHINIPSGEKPTGGSTAPHTEVKPDYAANTENVVNAPKIVKTSVPKRDVKLQRHLGELNLKVTASAEEIVARYNKLFEQLSLPKSRNHLDKITKAERLKRVIKAYEYIKIQKGI